MTGIALDSVNKPQKNALKVSIMLIANVIGDLIAVFVFESLILVAFSTIVFTLIGFVLGIFFLKNDIRISISKGLQGGIFVFEKLRDLITKKHVFNKSENLK